MSEQVHRCFCWSGLVDWPVRPDDRYCCLCGRRFTNVIPRGPVLANGPRTTLAAYLLPAANLGQRQGRLEFDLESLYPNSPKVRWVPSGEGVVISVAEQHQPTPDQLLLRLAAKDSAETQEPLVGIAKLEIELAGETFRFDVELYALESIQGVSWLHGTLNQPPAGSGYVIYREAGRGKLFLHYRLDGKPPLQWESVRCPHPAAEVHLLEPDQAGSTLCARVNWDTTHLRRDVAEESVPFYLKLRGLDEVVVEQRMIWRLRYPLVCQPAGLQVPILTRGQNELFVVQVTNTDLQTIKVDAVSPDAPWIVLVQGPTDPLPPGGTTTVILELKPDQIEEEPGPHSGQITFVLAGRGQQAYHVDVQKVRSPRVLTASLLIDPGPPRIVLAFVDPIDDHFDYLPGSGSIGLEPEQLGLSVPEYLEAVYDHPTTPPILERLTVLVRAWALRQGLDVQRMLLCRQPWLPASLSLPDGELIDWTFLCRQRILRQTGLPAATTCVRLDAWEAYLLEATSSANALPQVRPVKGRGTMLGDGVVRCLLQQLAPLSRADGEQLRWFESRDSQTHALPRWLFLACEALLADYRWGPDYAWRRLFDAVSRRLPSTRARAIDVSRADQNFHDEVRDHVRRLFQALRQAPGRRAIRTYALLSTLFARESMVAAIQSLTTELDLQAVAIPPRWLEWLGQCQRETTERAQEAGETGD